MREGGAASSDEEEDGAAQDERSDRGEVACAERAVQAFRGRRASAMPATPSATATSAASRV